MTALSTLAIHNLPHFDKRRIDEVLQDEILHIVTCLWAPHRARQNIEKGGRLATWAHVPISYFTDCYPLTDNIIAMQDELCPAQHFAPGEVRVADHPIGWSYTYFCKSLLDDGTGPTDSFDGKLLAGVLTRSRRVDQRELRGRAVFDRHYHAIIEHATALVYQNGTYWSHRQYYGATDAGESTWMEIVCPSLYSIQRREALPAAADTLASIQVSTTLSFSMRYRWHAAIGCHDSPRVLLDTDPSGVRALFALREIADGKKRRDALLHWVTGHWRKIGRNDAADRTWVECHLRGQRQFHWHDMDVVITPSGYEQDRQIPTKKR